MALGSLPDADLLLPAGEEPPSSASPQDLSAHPELARLLQDLGRVLGGDGLSPALRQELRQAEGSLGRARGLWLPLELLWRLLMELIRDPRDFDPHVLRALEQELTWAQVRRGPPEIAQLAPRPQPSPILSQLLPELERRLREKREELEDFLMGPTKIPKNPEIPTKNPEIPSKIPQTAAKIPENPPEVSSGIPTKIPEAPAKTHGIPAKIPDVPKISKDPEIPTKIAARIPSKPTKIPVGIAAKIPEIPTKVLEAPATIPDIPEISRNPGIPPEIPEIPTQIPAKTPKVPGFGPKTVLNSLLRERLRERLLQERLRRLNWEYPQALQRCHALLTHLRQLQEVQAHLDQCRGQYLLAKGGATLLKARLEELRVLVETYPSATVTAHRHIRAGLSRLRWAAQQEVAILEEELKAFQELGPEFRELALELGRVQEEKAQKGWALSQLRPPPH